MLGFVAFAAEFGAVVEFSELLEVAELAESGLVAELPEALVESEGEVAEPEGEVVALLLSAGAVLLGFDMPFGGTAVLELPVVEPLVPALWANAIGAKAATDNAKPAPTK